MELKKRSEQLVKWLSDDMRSRNPKLTFTIFSATEVAQKAKLEFTPEELAIVFNKLEVLRILTKTNKLSPDGPYYNINLKTYSAYHNLKAWVKNAVYRAGKQGYCIIDGRTKRFKLLCTGRRCPFYFRHEQLCVQGKFFVK